ncbi:MAG: hypothetical protein ACRDP8_02390 [Actinopolymorphaceae bacterium]
MGAHAVHIAPRAPWRTIDLACACQSNLDVGVTLLWTLRLISATAVIVATIIPAAGENAVAVLITALALDTIIGACRRRHDQKAQQKRQRKAK